MSTKCRFVRHLLWGRLRTSQFHVHVKQFSSKLTSNYPKFEIAGIHNAESIDKTSNEAISNHTDRVLSDDPEAQISLGWCYYNGIGAAKNINRAAELFASAAKLGHAEAQYGYGMCYLNGLGVLESSLEAAENFKLAADQGHLEAKYELGHCYWREKKFEEAYTLYNSVIANSAKHQGALVGLGMCYLNGFGIEPNAETAARLFCTAAQEGNHRAQYMLGKCHASGQGVQYDQCKAVHCYKLAAAGGLAEAEFALGACYEIGVGGLNKDISKAVSYIERAADNGCADAQVNLANRHASGVGVILSDEAALHYYDMAARQGHADAQCKLFKMFGQSAYLKAAQQQDQHASSSAVSSRVLTGSWLVLSTLAPFIIAFSVALAVI